MNQYYAYKQASVNTASPSRLLVMLYDGLLRFMDQAVANLEVNKIEHAHKALIRAQDIVLELQSTLDREKSLEVSQNLHDLYLFFNSKLTDANREKNAEYVKDIRKLVQELRDAFAQAERELAQEGQD